MEGVPPVEGGCSASVEGKEESGREGSDESGNGGTELKVVTVLVVAVLVGLRRVLFLLLGYDEAIAGVDDVVREEKDME
jgi:hypothetical protein